MFFISRQFYLTTLLLAIFFISLSSRGKGLVHLVDLCLVDFLSDVSLHLESGCQDVVLNCEWLVRQVNLLWLFQTVELLSLGNLVDGIHHNLDVFGLVCVDVSYFFAVFFGPSTEGLIIRDYDGHGTVFVGVSIDHDLSNLWRLDIGVLQLFRSQIFALREFEDVLGPVDDLYCSVRVNHTNISGEEPAVNDGFSSFVRSLEVSIEDH